MNYFMDEHEQTTKIVINRISCMLYHNLVCFLGIFVKKYMVNDSIGHSKHHRCDPDKMVLPVSSINRTRSFVFNNLTTDIPTIRHRIMRGIVFGSFIKSFLVVNISSERIVLSMYFNGKHIILTFLRHDNLVASRREY